MDWKTWFENHKGQLFNLLLIVVVVGFGILTNTRVSTVEGDVEEMYSPLAPYLPEEWQATIGDLLARWDEVEPTVVNIEDWYADLQDQNDDTGVTYGYQTSVYMTNGGDKQVVASGGEVEFQSGSTLDIQSGVTAGIDDLTVATFEATDTATFSKGSGDAAVISAGGTLSLPATADISAYGYVAVGDGTPNGSVTAGTNEQLYVEGAMEVDGELEADGAIDADSTSDFADTATFSKGSGDAAVIAAGGTLSLPATADVSAYGYVAVGNGTPDGSVTAGTNEQLYVEGAMEVDGELEADGAIDADSTLNVADTATFSKGSGDAVVILAGGVLSLPATADISAYGYTAIGDGTPDGSVTAGTDEQLYCEGAFEVDGELEADGAIDADSTLDVADTATFSKGSGDAVVISAGGTLSLPATADVSAYGYVAVGNGTPDGSVTAGTDEALYVEGALEVDGELEADGNVDADGDLDVDGTANLDEVDIDGVTNLVVGTEHIGALTVHSVSITYTAAAGGSGTVATIADGEIWFVYSVFVRTTTSFDCTGDDAFLNIGDGNDPDGFLALADASIQSSFTEATGYAAGWAGIENGSGGAYTLDDGGPFVYAPSGSAETIDWLLDETSGETITAGEATIYVVYMRIQ